MADIRMTKRLDDLVGAVAYPRDFHLNFESDSVASGEIGGKRVEVRRLRKNSFLVSVGSIKPILLSSESDANNFLAIVAGYDH